MRFLIAGLAMLVATSVAAHDETSNHAHDSVAPAADASIVDKRIHRFKQSGAAIQSIFKEHLGADDFAAIGSGTRSDNVGAVAMVITPRSLTTSGFRFTCEYNNGDVWDFKNIFLSILGDL
mgnify:CR=1 FL=1